MRVLLIISFAFCLCVRAQAGDWVSENDVTELMIKHVQKRQTRDEITEFQKILRVISFPNYVLRASSMTYQKPRATITCLACRSFVSTFIELYRGGTPKPVLIDMAVNLCVTLQIQPENVCRGVVELNADIIWYLLDNQPLINSKSLCGMVLQSEDRNACPITDPRYEWTVNIPEKKNRPKRPTGAKNKNGPPFRVVHISDNHIDPVYEPGGLAECDEPTCCRMGQTRKASHRWRRPREDDFSLRDNVMIDENGVIYINLDNADIMDSDNREREPKEMNDNDRAGYWGDYRDCDSPWWGFEDAVDHIADNQNFDYVYYTGDVIDHGVWETTYEMITNSINDTFTKFKQAFGNKPVYAIIGNHESQPMNQYAPSIVDDPTVSTKWLYELLWDKWSVWLPEDTKATIMQGGFYTVLVRPGFRIIVLNSNLCYTYNWWIHLDPEDPSGQFAWFVDTLLKAEEANEKVHILSHIPAGKTDTYYVCTREYTRIIRRFSNIIVAEFNGHSHKDEFKLFHNDADEPFAVAWNGGSLTSYSNVNPNYRLYDVNGTTYDLIDANTWIYNLTEANLTPERRPRWFREYSFRQQYGIPSLSAQNVESVVKRMVSTDPLLITKDYHRFRGKSADPYVGNGCNKRCVRNYLCYMLRTDVYENSKCEEYFNRFNETNPDFY